MRILGISGWYHDSAAALLVDGRLVAAAQEERFTRRKHDASFPAHAVRYCLSEAGITEVDAIAFYDKPLLKFHRILETQLAVVPRGLPQWLRAMPVWLREKLWIEPTLRTEVRRCGAKLAGEVFFPSHHESHAASAFFPSPFERAAVLTVDGVGEWATASVSSGEGSQLRMLQQLEFPHSLGLLYSAFTGFCGFKVNSGEYKLMGLAPYGEPVYADTIREELLDLKADGSFRLRMEHFGFLDSDRVWGSGFDALFGGPAREPESRITRREVDLARSIQAVTEEVVLRMAHHVHRLTESANLCMSGGVALNCVANGRILREGPFDALWIQPAAGDAGGAVGAAYAVWHGECGAPRQPGDAMSGAYLGPSYTHEECVRFLEDQGAVYEVLEEEDVPERVAACLAEGRVVGHFAGRMEFGPRALGNRSILGDPRSAETQTTMNQKIKYRESFRPFAPSVLEEHAAEWFDLDGASPYMLLVAPVAAHKRLETEPVQDATDLLERVRQARSEIPAVTHVDYSARIQTVSAATNPRYHAILSAFHARTGCPVVVNTSFNVRGEPIVCSPEDAWRCFLATEMDDLVLGRLHLRKSRQARALLDGARERVFEPD